MSRSNTKDKPKISYKAKMSSQDLNSFFTKEEREKKEEEE